MTNSARSNCLLNWARVVWGWKHKSPATTDWAKAQSAKKERLNNPAYRPKIDTEKLEMAGEIWAEIVKWPISNYEDRPVRSLAVLRFLPHLEELEIDAAEIADLGPIAGLSKLRKLKLGEPANGGHITKDLTPLAGLAMLEVVTLNLRAPWPNLSALGKLPALRRLDLYGNVLAFCGIPELPALRTGNLRGDHRWNVPVRSLGELPSMPRLERFTMKGVADLQGAAHLGTVRNLDLEGPFADLAPLTALQEITSLRLEGERFMDLSPLVHLANLRELVLLRERPLDLAPLSDSSSLREVKVERCTILQTELAALNAALLPWDGDFFSPEPRELPPLQILHVESKHPDVKAVLALPKPPDPRLAEYGDDRALAAAEARWFAEHLQRRLDALLGKGWGVSTGSGSLAAGHQHLDIKRFRDVTRLGEVIHAIRELIASCRFPWELLISVEPHGDLSEEMEEIRAREAGSEKPWWKRNSTPRKNARSTRNSAENAASFSSDSSASTGCVCSSSRARASIPRISRPLRRV
jgi:hypothetical protein